MDNVQCVNCGYLALRNIQTRQLAEAESAIRSYRENPKREDGGHIYEYRPICFRMEPKFAEEAESLKFDDMRDLEYIIDQDRNCESFNQWKQGWTPKEHFEMDMLEREKARIERKEARDLEQQNREEARSVREEERHDIEVKSARTAIRNHYIELIIIGVLAIAAAWVQFTTVNMQLEFQRNATANK